MTDEETERRFWNAESAVEPGVPRWKAYGLTISYPMTDEAISNVVQVGMDEPKLTNITADTGPSDERESETRPGRFSALAVQQADHMSAERAHLLQHDSTLWPREALSSLTATEVEMYHRHGLLDLPPVRRHRLRARLAAAFRSVADRLEG